MSKSPSVWNVLGLGVVLFMIGMVAAILTKAPEPHHAEITIAGLILVSSFVLMFAGVALGIWRTLWRSAGRNMEAGKRSV